MGMNSLFECYVKVETNAKIVLKAFGIYGIGHRDIIDCLLYSIALNNNMKFASLDKELRKFVRDNNLRYVFFE